MFKINIIKYFTFIIFFKKIISKTCGQKEIEFCQQCGTGENINKCSLCEDNYFSLLGGEVCIKCDDEIFGMEGCGGNCEFNEQTKTIKCQENSCKINYYEISPGICETCSSYDNTCKKCSYNEEEGNKIFKCLECQDYYYLYSGEYCRKCSPNLECKKCSREYYCEECKEGYARSSEQKCYFSASNCIEATYSEEEKKAICSKCEEGYFLDNEDNNCYKCDEYQTKYEIEIKGCKKCRLKETELICEKISEYYTNIDGEIESYCDKLISNCILCSFHSEEDLKNRILKCDECRGDTYISSDQTECKPCYEDENGCLICSDEKEDGFICQKCAPGYFLFSNGTCSKCSDYFGEGCSSCIFSPYDLSLHCTDCEEGYTLDIDGKCKNCFENEGCLNCNFIGKNGFVCEKCLDSYILDNGYCISKDSIGPEFSTCSDIKNIGTNEEIIYSCNKCNSNSAIFIEKENGGQICVEPTDELGLKYCQYGRKESIGDENYTCTQCSIEYNSQEELMILSYDETKQKKICHCKEGYFFYEFSFVSYCESCNKEISFCSKCHSDDYGTVKCDKCEEGYILYSDEYYTNCEKSIDYCVEFSTVNSQIKCIKFREPYFLNKNSKVESCLTYLDNCIQCSYTGQNLKCNKCKDDFFLNKNGICEPCSSNTKIGFYCMSCTDNEDTKEKYPCQKCDENYFLTKGYTCIYCKSENYGGKFCKECGYININGEEKIGCLKCLDDNNYKINKNGKCYKIVENCIKYGEYVNQYNSKDYGCILCKDYYYLDSNNECSQISLSNCINAELQNKKEICVLCENGYLLDDYKCVINNVPSDDLIIVGCLSYKYTDDYSLCTKCDSNYLLQNGFCYKYPDNILLKECNNYKIEDGIMKCTGCNNFYYNTFQSFLMCGYDYFGECELINLGDELNPIYSCGKCEYTSMTDENGITKCIRGIFNERCEKGLVNTEYLKDIYTCIKCFDNYILSYSEDYEKNICKDIYKDNLDDEGIVGSCSNGYFSKTGEECIKCDDENKGMPGCDGNCNFKKNRENKLLCEIDKCKEGYFESLPGLCELCNSFLPNCEQCEYIINDEQNSIIPKRKRKLVCKQCKEGYLYKNNICVSCYDEMSNCKECKIESNDFVCLSVKDGYYFDKFGNIQKCQDNCDKCILDNSGLSPKVICKTTSYGYFINERGIIQKCKANCDKCYLTEIGGIRQQICTVASRGFYLNIQKELIKCSNSINNCEACTYSAYVTCTSCETGYILSNNRCKQKSVPTLIEGCQYQEKNSDGNYECLFCDSGYIYISDSKKCSKKTEETKLCEKAETININGINKQNCTECTYNKAKLIKEQNGLFSCYDSSLISRIENCSSIENFGTFDEPSFICMECKNKYIMVYDEYDAKNCELNILYTNCTKIKRKKYFSSKDNAYIYEYNCIECKDKYELINDEITNKITCEMKKCEDIGCKNCSGGFYTCFECFEGYFLNNFGFCYKIPEIAPTIVFKDIYKFSLNGTFKLYDNKNLYGITFRLRGITVDDIPDKHSFNISLELYQKYNIRQLEMTKIFEASCLNVNNNKNEENNINYIDYDCYSDTKNARLLNFKLVSIEEGENENNNNLNAINLDNLVNNTNDIEKSESILTESERNKYLLFKVDEESKNIKITDIKSNIVINGKTNKILTDELTINLLFTNKEIVNCKINAKDKDNSKLICSAKLSPVSRYNPYNKFFFEEEEILGTNNNYYFIGLKDIEIENKVYEQVSEGDEEEEQGNVKKNKKNNGVIVGLLFGGSVIIIVIIVSIIINRKKLEDLLNKGKLKGEEEDMNYKTTDNEKEIIKKRKNKKDNDTNTEILSKTYSKHSKNSRKNRKKKTHKSQNTEKKNE